jgi:hypothetical protein
MKINNEKNEYNECSFFERVHNLFNKLIIFLDISMTSFDISAISNDNISNFLQAFVLNEIQFLSDSFDSVCFEHSKFVHRVKYIIYTHQQTFTHNNIVRIYDILLRHIFILRNRRSYITERDDRASTTKRDDRAQTAERDNRAQTAERNDRASTAKRDDRASTTKKDDRATNAKKDDQATTAEKDHRATTTNNSTRTFKHFVQNES